MSTVGLYDVTGGTFPGSLVCNSTLIINGSTCVNAALALRHITCGNAMTSGHVYMMEQGGGTCSGFPPSLAGTFTVQYP